MRDPHTRPPFPTTTSYYILQIFRLPDSVHSDFGAL